MRTSDTQVPALLRAGKTAGELRRKVVRAIALHGPCTRMQIAKHVGRPINCITAHVRSLLDDGTAEEVRQVEDNGTGCKAWAIQIKGTPCPE